jgi:hypothetical protein
LKETVADRGALIEGDWVSTEYKKKFVDAVVLAMQSDDGTDRLNLQQYAAQHFDLDILAQDWEKMFSCLIEEIMDSPIVPYVI